MSEFLVILGRRHSPLPLPRPNRCNIPIYLSRITCCIEVTNVSDGRTGTRRGIITNLGPRKHGDAVVDRLGEGEWVTLPLTEKKFSASTLISTDQVFDRLDHAAIPEQHPAVHT